MESNAICKYISNTEILKNTNIILSNIKLNLIAAVNLDGIIGIENSDGFSIPWYVPEDLAHFKLVTMNNIIIIGRKTFESMRSKPLKNRITIVITTNPHKYTDNVCGSSKTPFKCQGGCGNWNNNFSKEKVYFCNLEGFACIATQLQKQYENKRFFVCGGAEIYKFFWDLCDNIYITQICCKSLQIQGTKNIVFPCNLSEITSKYKFDIIIVNGMQMSRENIGYNFYTYMGKK